jgi:hypothetical protein
MRQAKGKVEIPAGNREALEYIQSMLGQLRIMADAEGCDFLAYMIEMAYIEAGDIARGLRPRRVGEEKAGTAGNSKQEPKGKAQFQ